MPPYDYSFSANELITSANLNKINDDANNAVDDIHPQYRLNLFDGTLYHINTSGAIGGAWYKIYPSGAPVSSEFAFKAATAGGDAGILTVRVGFRYYTAPVYMRDIIVKFDHNLSRYSASNRCRLYITRRDPNIVGTSNSNIILFDSGDVYPTGAGVNVNWYEYSTSQNLSTLGAIDEDYIFISVMLFSAVVDSNDCRVKDLRVIWG